MSMGADIKANTIRARVSSSLLERGEARVFLEALCKSSYAFVSETVAGKPAGTGKCSLFCQGALTEKRTFLLGSSVEQPTRAR